jgi:phosphohistidine phosphatase
MGSYLMLRGTVPDAMLSSCALRAQETADGLAKKVGFDGKIHYLSELYFGSMETMFQTVALQEEDVQTLFLIGHNPHITAFANLLTKEHISKIPTMGIAALTFDIESWNQLESVKGDVDFFIFPKQFEYYMPNQIRAVLDLEP